MQKLKNINWLKLLKNKYFIIGLIVLAVILFFTLRSGGEKVTLQYAEAQYGDILQKVSITGRVYPASKADLSFDIGGSISSISTKAGDVVKKGQILASLSNNDAVASLVSAEAKLADMRRVLRPEELAVEEARLQNASNTLANAKISARNAARDAYTKAQSAMVNYADSLFDNAQSVNPTIKIVTESSSKERNLNDGKLTSTEKLESLRLALEDQSIKESDLLAKASDTLLFIKSFLLDLSDAVNYLTVANSALSQNAIDAYKTTVNTSMSILNTGITSLTTAKTTLDQSDASFLEIRDSFNLKVAGPSTESINAQAATVESLRAVVNKGRIISPIDGKVAKIDLEIGEYISPGKVVVSVHGGENFKAESFIPEADIAKIQLGDRADITLDAYGQYTVFGAHVTFIDGAETMIEGVPTYKTILDFDKVDSRIKSGMTANIDIIANERINVLTVPSRAIIDENGVRGVRVLRSDKKTYDFVPVEIGIKGSDGKTEIIDGIEVGDEMVTFLK